MLGGLGVVAYFMFSNSGTIPGASAVSNGSTPATGKVENGTANKTETLAEKLQNAIGMVQANADQWNFANQVLNNGQVQPDPESYLPTSVGRFDEFDAMAYIRMRGLTGLRRIA